MKNRNLKNTQYVISLQAAAAIIAAALAIAIAFPVSTGADISGDSAPYLVSSSPYNGQTGVSLSSSISCNFSAPVSAEASAGVFTLSKSGGGAIGIYVSSSGDGSDVIVTPSSGLEYSSIYTLTIGSGLVGSDGTVSGESYSITFVTELDPTPTEATTAASGSGTGTGGGAGRSIPVEVTSFYPYDGQNDVPLDVTISCQFSHNVAESSISGANMSHISLRKADGTYVAINTYVADTQVEFDKRQFIYAQPASSLEPGTQYILTVTAGVTAKNGISSTYDQSITFTTAGIAAGSETTAAQTTAAAAQTTAAAGQTTAETAQTSTKSAQETTAAAVTSNETESTSKTGQTKTDSNSKVTAASSEESSNDSTSSSDAAASNTDTDPVSAEAEGNPVLVIILIIAAVLIAAIVVFIILKKRKEK